MSKFKVGDKVRIVESSKWYGGGFNNPSDLTGTVLSAGDGDHLNIEVQRSNGGENTYRDHDLRLVKFTKSDLKDGMRVELRDGDVHYVCGDVAFRPTGGTSQSRYHLSQINEEMNHHDGNELCDVIKVTDRDGTVLFERKPEKRKPEKRKVTLELTDEQIESLKSQGVM